MDNLFRKDALIYHSKGRPGKIEVIPTKPYSTQRDLSLAYSPGVADPCLEIHKNRDDVYKYTAKGNLVAVISNGTAVLGLGDIGRYFPDTEPSFKGINSLILLEHVVGLAQTRKYRISNLDTTIVAQSPKLAPYVAQMITNLAKVCQVPSGCINVKATTTEEMGYTGRGEGISAHAVVLMETNGK